MKRVPWRRRSGTAAGVTRKGSHQSQKVINALSCLRRGRVEHRARGEAIRDPGISAQGGSGQEAFLEAAAGGRQGRRPSYVRKADGEFEARLVALSCAEPPEGYSQWSLGCWRTVSWSSATSTVARDGAPGPKKNAIKPWRRVWVIPPQGRGLPAAMEKVLDGRFPVVCMDETPRQLPTRFAAAPGRPAREDGTDARTIPNPWPGGAAR